MGFNNGKYGTGGYSPYGNETVALSLSSGDSTQIHTKPDPSVQGDIAVNHSEEP
eukprot:gene34250-42235_t